jgi:hypothetical protein
MFRMLARPNSESVPSNLEDRVRKLDQTVATLGEKMEQIESRLAVGRRVATWGK